MILASYADDSADGKQKEIITVGSVCGIPERFFEAERKWQEYLDKQGIEYFHSTDCEHLEGEFRPERRGMSLDSARAFALSVRHDLIEIINNEQGIIGLSLAIVLPDFRELIEQNGRALNYYGNNPLQLLYNTLIKSTIELLNRDWPATAYLPIAFTFDERGGWQDAEEAYRKLKESDSIVSTRLGVVSHLDDKQHPPLQMADLIAYESRLKCNEWMVKSEQERHAFRQLTKMHSLYYIGMLTKESLLSQMEETGN